MKRTMIAAATVAALAAPAYAELEGDLSLTYHSQYNYRGVNGILENALGTDLTEDTFETEINAAYKLNDQWSLVAGGTIHSLTDTSVDHDRIRGGVRYTTDCYTVELGYQSQDFRTVLGNLDTSEIYLNVGTQCPLTGADVNLFVAHDTDMLEGTYAELSFHKGWEVAENATFGVTAGVSYSFDYWENLIGTGSDWNHGYITLSLAYQATENLTLTPYVTFSQGFDALDATSTVGPGVEEEDEITYGLKASVQF
ncbi:hypothetical protein JO972_06715 [Verrucomicrobiaceae bacterium 5K15]|uniref:Porin n=1 Tax=Oceaniferula flava TaxID=2800421 RepID=A0AAE2SA79_9BACT|nr:hypothetical protein [Oceaniferula flavus]MBK1854643.1 hypothetical protein [Oceaniferula flavus]MBM1135949.1 hypothetical protein [Oceaniferula flavus]